MSHAQVPIEEIGRWIDAGRPGTDAPLDYLAVHESYGEPVLALPDVSVRRRILPQRQPAAPLVVTSALTRDNRLRLRAAYRLPPGPAARVPDYLSSLADAAGGERKC